MQRVFLLLWCLLLGSALSAQNTRVRGKITDAATGEPLPFVNVVFKGTTIGVTSDFDGLYTLETREPVTVLYVSFLGYEVQEVKIVPGAFHAIDCRLVPLPFELDQVTVTPGENPAHAILKNISRNKKRNNPEELPQYNLSTYTRMELDLTNINPEFKNKRLQKNFGFIFDYMDTSVITGKAFLPVMISEASADYYRRKSPDFSREIVKASRISGIKEDYSLAQFTGHLHGNINFYNNYIDLFEIKFASPISDHGLLYYKYYLIDSLELNGRKTYKIRFHPKSFSTPVLDGEIQIDSASWALESVTAKMVKGLNVNWIRNLVLENKNTLIDDSVWFPRQDKIFADFSLVMTDSSKIASFIGRRQIDYFDVELNKPFPEHVLKLDNNVIVSKDVLKNEESYWETVRPYELSLREKQIYNMVDSIREVPLFQNIYTILMTLIGGYYETEYIGIGPYYKLLSFNQLEGVRLQPGLNTTENFSKKIRFTGHTAYGTKDRTFKGGGGVEYMFNNQPTSKLHAAFKHDVVQLGAGINAFTESNILSSLFSRGNNSRLCLVNQGDLSWEKEWRQGFSNTYAAQVRSIYASPYVPFETPDNRPVESVKSLAFRIGTRLSKDEVVVRKVFSKYSLGSDYPVAGVDLTAGLKGVFKGEDYEYYRLEGYFQYDLEIPPAGTSEVAISGGKIFGKVPYPLLKLHEGNATFFYDPYAYSCMNYYEFASDLWFSLFYEHHFKGFFLGKIPLMKRLKWREVFTFKAVIGTLEDRNNGSLENSESILRFPEGMSSVSKPYFEAGVGVENILRFLRVDAVWRLSHRQEVPGQDIQKFVLNFSFNFDF